MSDNTPINNAFRFLATITFVVFAVGILSYLVFFNKPEWAAVQATLLSEPYYLTICVAGFLLCASQIIYALVAKGLAGTLKSAVVLNFGAGTVFFVAGIYCVIGHDSLVGSVLLLIASFVVPIIVVALTLRSWIREKKAS